MLIVMKKNATETQLQEAVATVEKKGFTARPIPGGDRVSIGVLHNKGSVDAAHFLGLDGPINLSAGNSGRKIPR